jgi:UDP-N-acetylglucosamine 2-epimerase
MSKKFKIVTVLGTRPEIIKMSALIKVLDEFVDHILVHTGQNYDYELNQVFFDELGLRAPDVFLNCAGAGYADTVGNVIQEIDRYLLEEKPDALVVYGDTNSCLAVYPAKRRGVPVFHLEAGNRCFDFRVPEEINRRIVDHLADVNFVLSEAARDNLLAEGLPSNRIFNVGSNMPEVIDNIMPQVNKSQIANELNLMPEFILISLHREENVDDPEVLRTIIQEINLLTEQQSCDVVWSMHPRLAKRLSDSALPAIHPKVKQSKPFGLVDYLWLQLNCKCLISDSGTVSEEASILSIPAVTIRNAHERLEGMERGVFSMSEKGADLAVQVELAIRKASVEQMRQPYPSTHNSSTIVKIILSYIPYINREVWKSI